MTSYTFNPHSASTKTSTATTSTHSYFSSVFGLIDEETVESEVPSPGPTHLIGDVFTVSCPLCEAPIDATLIETYPKAYPQSRRSLFLVYTSKQCECPDVSLNFRGSTTE
jgi:hypothetical protein